MITKTQTEQDCDQALAELNAELMDAAQSASDWLCEAHIGSDQYERGVRLREAIIKWEERDGDTD